MWRAGKPQDDFDFPSISDYLVEDDALVWCDIYDPDHAILADLAQELGLNAWAVEDAIAESERTKAVVYRTHTSSRCTASPPPRPPMKRSRCSTCTASPGSCCREG